MKKIIAGLALLGVVTGTQMAMAAAPAKAPGNACAAQSGDSLTITGDTAAASASASMHLLPGGLAHCTERNSASSSASVSSSVTPVVSDGQKVKTKSNIKNDRVASSSSSSDSAPH